jgi:mannose/fructose-specific phosphotransferase system component IIA
LKELLSKEIDQNRFGIILLSHGALAEGIQESLRMILGDIKNIVSLCLEEGDDVEAFGGEIAVIADMFSRGCIFLVDMLSGTPLNQFIMSTARDRCRAVSGLNLGMLCEVVIARDENSARETTLQKLAAVAVEAGIAGIVDVATMLDVVKRERK